MKNNEYIELTKGIAYSDCRPEDDIRLVTVVVVNYNCKEYIQNCLDSLAAQTLNEFKVIVIDNASTDGSQNTVKMPDHRFKMVRLKKNKGFSLANNLGAWLQPSKFIVTLNADAFAEPDWLQRLIEAANKHPDYAAFGSTQLFAYDTDIWDGAGDGVFFAGIPWRGGHKHLAKSLPDEYQTFSPCAAAALYRSDVFWEVGGFDEDFFCFCEDIDLGFRIRMMGMGCMQVSNAIVRHVSGGASKGFSLLSDYYGHRNAYWMQLKNYPVAILPVSLLLHVLCELIGLALLPQKNIDANSLLHVAKNRLRAMLQGLAHPKLLLKKRKASQRIRKCRQRDIIKMLTWSPILFIKKQIDMRDL